LGQAQKGGGVKSVNGIPLPQLLIWTVMITKSTITSHLWMYIKTTKEWNTQEKFVDTKRIIISRKSKDRQYNGQKKKGQTNTSIPEIYKYSNTSIPEIYKYSNTNIPEIYKYSNNSITWN
jgi:hypothetical protein